MLLIPYSNAELESIFSRLKKKNFRMFFLKTRWSILALKTMYPESDFLCSQWKPDENLLEAS